MSNVFVEWNSYIYLSTKSSNYIF